MCLRSPYLIINILSFLRNPSCPFPFVFKECYFFLVNQHFVHLQLQRICSKHFWKGKVQGKIVLQVERSQKALFLYNFPTTDKTSNFWSAGTALGNSKGNGYGDDSARQGVKDDNSFPFLSLTRSLA